MADTTGPISSLPGSAHPAPADAKCDFHPDRPAVTRIQGETDSFGSEMHDVCKECAQEMREDLRNRKGNCEWCEAQDVPVVDARCSDEGASGRVYSICKGCKAKQEARLREEAERDSYFCDDYDDGADDYCEHCHNTGELDCHCGGDLCVCSNNGTYPCPHCD